MLCWLYIVLMWVNSFGLRLILFWCLVSLGVIFFWIFWCVLLVLVWIRLKKMCDMWFRVLLLCFSVLMVLLKVVGLGLLVILWILVRCCFMFLLKVGR